MTSKSHVDDIDREIVFLLLQNARSTLADIGVQVSLSPAAVKRRIDRLEETGVILAYTMQIDYGQLGWPLEAFTELRYEGTAKVEDIEAAGRDIPEVQAIFTTAGDFDAIAYTRVRSMDHLKQVINKLRTNKGITGTKTLMVLGTRHRVVNPVPEEKQR